MKLLLAATGTCTLGIALAIGFLAASSTPATGQQARQCQWTYLVDPGAPEITGFPPHEPLAATQTGRNAMAKSKDPELKRRWEHLGQTGWQLKAAVAQGMTAGSVLYVFEHCQ